MAKQDIGADVVGVIVSKARAESAFRAKLVADGNGAMKALGIPVPDGVTVKFVEDTPSVWHFVIPAEAGELSDADLEHVAGGFGQQLGQQLGGQQLGGLKQLDRTGGLDIDKIAPGAPAQLSRRFD